MRNVREHIHTQLFLGGLFIRDGCLQWWTAKNTVSFKMYSMSSTCFLGKIGDVRCYLDAIVTFSAVLDLFRAPVGGTAF